MFLAAADFKENPLYVSYDLLEESSKEELRDSALEQLHFMRMQGFEPAKLKTKLSRSVSEYDSMKYQKFALQFFNMFCGFLESASDQTIDFLLKVMFPTATSYLQKYMGYFMPTTDIQESSTTASDEEKLRIIEYDLVP